MATFTKFNSFVEEMAHGEHDLETDQITVALCNASNAPAASDSVLADLTTIAYTNLSSRNVTTTSSGQTSGTYTLALQDLTLTASGGAVAAFRYVVLYNEDSTGDMLIGFYDYGSEVTLADGETFDIDFAANSIQLA